MFSIKRAVRSIRANRAEEKARRIHLYSDLPKDAFDMDDVRISTVESKYGNFEVWHNVKLGFYPKFDNDSDEKAFGREYFGTDKKCAKSALMFMRDQCRNVKGSSYATARG